MSKYIIEIEDEPFVRLSALFGEEGLYRAKGFKSLVFDQLGLDKLTPLDKALNETYLQGRNDAEQDLARAAYEEAYHKGFKAGQHEATTLEYQQGLEEGKKQARAQAHLDVCHDIERVAHGNYQKGLDDAWGTIIKIALIPYAERSEIFDGQQDILSIMQKFSPSEVITKIKAYEEQQKADEIKVGDEVEWEGEKIIVTQTFTPNLQKPQLHGIGSNGCVYYAILIEDVKKTGRHFPQVVELIKAMKEGAE